MDGTLYLGTSGFAYDEWKHGVFYPEGLKNREMLSYYASRFPSVEINYTFRRFPTEKSVETWKAETPETFRFTLKANQRITHWKRLADTDEDVRDFLDRGRLLGDRLGTVLYQCPPTLQYDRGLIEAFVGYLPSDPSSGDGVPPPVVGGRRAISCWNRASPGASPRPTRTTRVPTICRGSRSASSACGRPSTRTMS